MAEKLAPRFTAEQIAALWPNCPDPASTAEALSALDYTVHFTPEHKIGDEQRRPAAKFRSTAALFDDATLHPQTRGALIAAVRFAYAPAPPLDGEQFAAAVASANALPGVLTRAAEQLEENARDGLPSRGFVLQTQAAALARIYQGVIHVMEQQIGRKARHRPDSADARFVQLVLEHAGVPWRPATWRKAIKLWSWTPVSK